MDAQRVVEILHALANTDRVRLVEELARSSGSAGPESGMTIASLAERIEVSRFSASRHLAMLREAGLVVRRRLGVKSIHVIDTAALEELEDWLYSVRDDLGADERVEIA